MDKDAELKDFPSQDADTWFRRAKVAEMRCKDLNAEIARMRGLKPLSAEDIQAINAAAKVKGGHGN